MIAIPDTRFIDWDAFPELQVAPGVRTRTPYGRNIMLSLIEIDEGCEVPTHSHPHEQSGIVLEGRLALTIGPETRTLEPGEAYIVPPNVPHRAVAVGGPMKALDIFSPIREDLAQRSDQNVFKQGKV